MEERSFNAVCKLYYSTPMIKDDGSQIIVYRKITGYISAFDKEIDFGERIINKIPYEQYRKIVERHSKTIGAYKIFD